MLSRVQVPAAVRFTDSESAFALQPALALVKLPFTDPQRRGAGPAGHGSRQDLFIPNRLLLTFYMRM
jgi:hypothetical protein